MNNFHKKYMVLYEHYDYFGGERRERECYDTAAEDVGESNLKKMSKSLLSILQAQNPTGRKHIQCNPVTVATAVVGKTPSKNTSSKLITMCYRRYGQNK